MPSTPESITRPTGSNQGEQRRRLLAIALCILCLLIVGLFAFELWQSRRLGSQRSTLAAQQAALQAMTKDAARIAELRATPVRAVEAQRASDEILALIDDTLSGAGIPRTCWQDSVPQPPQRDAAGPYQRITTRLYFENVNLAQLTDFTHRLLTTDPTLFLTSLRLVAGRDSRSGSSDTGEPLWDAELAVSYRVVDAATATR